MNLRNSKHMQQLVLLGILIVLVIVFSCISDNFFTFINITNLIRQQAMVAIIAFGATFIMISRGLDISVGSTVALSGVIYAFGVQKGISIPVSCMLAVLSGGVVGALNALMVVGARINPVIATLGTMLSVRGVAYLVAPNNRAIVNGLPLEFMNLGRGYIGKIPIPVVIMIIIFILFHFILSKTLLGKYTYAIGGNPETSRLSGIPVKKVLATVYILTGLLTGLSGAMMASRLNSGNPQIGEGWEFDVIIAVFLGGVSMSGGEGTMVGTLLGALIIGVIQNGMNIAGINPFYQYVIRGVVLVLAVIIDMTLKGKGIQFKQLSRVSAPKKGQVEA